MPYPRDGRSIALILRRPPQPILTIPVFVLTNVEVHAISALIDWLIHKILPLVYPHLHPPHSSWLSASSIEYRVSFRASPSLYSTFDTERSTRTGSQDILKVSLSSQRFISISIRFDSIRFDSIRFDPIRYIAQCRARYGEG